MSAGTIQYLYTHETQPVDAVNVVSEGNQHSFSIQVQNASPTPNFESNGEQWIRHTTKLPVTERQFVHSENTFDDVSSSGATNVVVPGGNQQHSFSIQVQNASSTPNVEKSNGEQWIRHTTKLPVTERQFVLSDNAFDDVSSSGATNVVVPGGNQQSFSIQVQNASSSPNIEKSNGEQWIRHTSRLPAGETEFVQTDQTHQFITLDGSSTGSVVIPIQMQHVSSPPKRRDTRRVTEHTKTTEQVDVPRIHKST
ncbi:hypothetical protein OS493_008624 [Desmophyllum pertusum]|uniref:Uncharacterized protein n=1 Tax=Desmophyllum pertusum TaxID=174260 RepID=A0A9X0D4E9_9CNID|nr:hypothetical protein OS493_008624 [Desmophyllum pertusum]